MGWLNSSSIHHLNFRPYIELSVPKTVYHGKLYASDPVFVTFRRTEPHSPVSYLVQRAITWGQMPLDAWLVDVIKDNNVLAGLRETLGLKGESGPSSGT